MKRAILTLIEGHNDTNTTPLQKNMAEESLRFAQERGLSSRTITYDFDHSEDVTYTLGKMVKFAVGFKHTDNGESMDQTVEENQKEQAVKFTTWVKPIIKDLLKEVWYGKNKLPEKKEEVTAEVTTPA